MRFFNRLIFFVIAFSLSCGVFADEIPKKHLGLHHHWIDSTVQPDDDFYDYANGQWDKKHEIPADATLYNAFSKADHKNEMIIKNCLESLIQSGNVQPGSIEQKAIDFYQSGMDTQTIAQVGIAPLEPALHEIQSIQTLNNLQTTIAHLQTMGVAAPFQFQSGLDYYDSSRWIAVISLSSLGLPGPEYYLDKNYQNIRDAYQNHIATMLGLLGHTPEKASDEARSIMQMETQLAGSIYNDENPFPHTKKLKELVKVLPAINWKLYLMDIGNPNVSDILYSDAVCRAINNELTHYSLANWKTFLTWQLIQTFAANLADPFYAEHVSFQKKLFGDTALPERWYIVLKREESVVGFALGKLYVTQTFNEETKVAALTLSNNIQNTLRNRIENLSWMSADTKKAALNKLDAMKIEIGSPAEWPSYTGLIFDPHAYLANIIQANRYYFKSDMNSIGTHRTKTIWPILPQAVNAMYEPSSNRVIIPAGILQPPFFDSHALPVLNYATLGFILGHEMTHGFDNWGSFYNADGNVADWWTAEDRKKFDDEGLCIANQFSQFSIPINDENGSTVLEKGTQVEGEAIADLGGLTIAYDAYHNSDAYQQAKTLHNLTPDQQFFIAAAHGWISKSLPEINLYLAIVDAHPFPLHRINGTLANMPEFQTAFFIHENATMSNTTPCHIW